MVFLQPADWLEQDVKFKYVVDVFGRTDKNEVAQVRLTGFRPYFFLRMKDGETKEQLHMALEHSSGKMLRDLKITLECKLDAMKGFNGLQPVKVWKLSFPALWMFKTIQKTLKHSCKIGSRKVLVEDIYETNLPPFIRLFHELNLSPASPIEFEGDDYEPDENVHVDVLYEVPYQDVKIADKQIPLLVAAYDIETYSVSGLFPVATNPGDEIMQIGISFRYSDKLLEAGKRVVLSNGTISASKDPGVQFIECKNERDILLQFEKCIRQENPDIIAGFNTFGFDDPYIADRAERHKLYLSFGRTEGSSWKSDYVKTEKKTFELASGKFAVRYFEMPGRLPIDLLLSVRREQNLDSYKLDNVASTFLRDKVLKIEKLDFNRTKIYTKSTRGLFRGNLVRFDIVGNTMNPYKEGKKFETEIIEPKFFVIQSDEEMLIDVDIQKLEWSFTKDDISVKDMFAAHIGSAEQKAVVAKYCIQDCDLVLTLMAKLDTLVNARGMADVCKVPMQYIFLRGQGIKIFSAVVFNASKRNQIIMSQENVEGDTSYEGAIVLAPKIGMYLDQPIAVLDFNSLYPSNMIAFNLSPDTLCYVKTYDAKGKKISQEGEEVKNYKIDEIGYDTYDDKKNPTGRIVCGYVQPTDDPRTVGVIPLTLDILLKKRKETRKLMETTEDDAQKAVLNGLQLAYKTVANSVYGQCGSRTSPIRKLEVAACTTAAGRDRIYFAKKIVETEYGAHVIYGDSVASYTPVIVKIHNKVQIVCIDESAKEWTKYGDKESCELSNIESWTEQGWTPVHRIIRHKLDPKKKMVRVLTHTGMVDVTDDHSLLKQDATEVSPKDIAIGDTLLHTQYPEIPEGTNCEVEKARIWGFFFGDGSCGTYQCSSGQKSSWALNNANIEVLTTYQTLCQVVYPLLEWKIHPTLVSSGVYKLVPISQEYGSLRKFIDEFRTMLYIDRRKHIPEWILHGSQKVRSAFWDGLYDADGDKDMNGYIRIDQKHQSTCAEIALLGHLLGYKVSLNDRKDKLQICRLTFTSNSQRKHENAVKKMYQIPYEGYVYDLTTDNHHFQAGIGKMIVHNTDSIFIKFPTKDLAESIELGQKSAARITELCRKPYKIEYEKTMFPFVMFCRKRYVGMLYETDVTKCYRKTMGVALKRRDNAPIVKDIFGGALDILMEKRDIKPAQEFVKQKLVEVLENRLPLEKYIITKQLRDDYKNPAQIAHRVLADRMAERDPGTAPQVGDRLPYIYVAENAGYKKQGEKIEHVDYVKDKGLHPDTAFYISNQIQNPVAQLFALAIENLDGYVSKQNFAKLFQELLDSGIDEEEATLKILEKKEKELESILFLKSPELSKILIKRGHSMVRGPMDAFIRK